MPIYPVTHLRCPLPIDACWGKSAWAEMPALTLSHFMGSRPAHFPAVQARLAYDAEALYVIFRVEDRYVRALARAYQDEVYKDSCVELFFTPGEDIAQGYFNLEMNCGGVALFHHQRGRGVEDVPVLPADFAALQVAHSLPERVDPEITAALHWVVEYRLPLAILRPYAPVAAPAQGVQWRANFYKCADGSSHPHWLTWSAVQAPEPDFHRPEFFGRLIF